MFSYSHIFQHLQSLDNLSNERLLCSDGSNEFHDRTLSDCCWRLASWSAVELPKIQTNIKPYNPLLINCDKMSIHEIKDSIYIIKDLFIPDPGKCDEIVTFIKENKPLHQYIEVNPYKNNVECSFIRINDNNTNEYLSTLDEYIKNKVGEIIKLIVSENPFFPRNVFDNGYDLRQIHGGTVVHIDGILDNSNAKKPRLLSIIINLNDEYEGGEFHFPKQDVKIRLKKGEAICFPPYWTHPHEVSSVSFGEYRYTINTWILQ